jgi:hypothetical protein
LDSSERDTTSDGKLRSTPTVAPSCASTGPTQGATETCGESAPTTLSQLMLFAEDSRVRTSVSPALVPDWQAPDLDSGASIGESFASYDHATSSWRTSQRCLDGDLERFSETWPRAGMTQSGIAYQRQPLAPLTREIASGSWPTPDARDSQPEGFEAGMRRRERWSTWGLQTAVRARMWPTPTGRDYEDGTAQSCANVPGGENLRTAVNGSLSPLWVEWLMGYPLGWTVLEDSAMPSSRKSRRGSRSGSRKPKP